MTLHDFVFAGVELARLVQDLQRNTGLADVVERSGNPEPRHVNTRKSDLDAKADGHARDQQAMLERTFVIAAHLVEIGREPAALDAIDDLRGRARGIRKTDRLAGLHR